ncbi:heptaprenyl pyrophosphate synthase subunit A, partial [Staphylococcus aureus]|nr:heptaprenyl pyrophosphate synthase subunit A [Staphylococcus aureus]
HLSKHSILIGDLIIAHFYTLLEEINDLSFQIEISKSIVEINELKSSLHHQALYDYEISQAIVNIETLFPYITLSHFGI